MADEFQLTVQDPGLGLVQEASSTPLFYGPCSGGSANAFESFNSIPDLVAAHPQGPNVEAAAWVLANGGGPVRCIKAATSVASANSAVTASGAGPTVSIAGTANDFYDLVIEVMLGGALGAGGFRYTLDGGQTYSETLTIPAGGTFAIPGTGITVTFTSGTYLLGETYSATTTPAMWNATDLAAGMNVILADFTPWDFFVGTGRQSSGAAAAAIGAALQTHLNTLTNQQRPARGMIDAGNEVHTAIQTAYASVATSRVLYAYRGLRRSSAKAMVGWGSPLLSAVDGFALLAARSLISTDLGRFASNNLAEFGARSIDYDEEKTAALDAHRIATLRTFPGISGIWAKNGRLKAAAGSDFQFWQYGRVMDIACRTQYLASLPFVNAGLRTIAGGALDPRDITRVEDQINDQLRAVLTQPVNAEGTPGHVTDVRFTVDPTWNAQQTQTVKGELAIVPLAYAKKIRVTAGFTASLLPLAA